MANNPLLDQAEDFLARYHSEGSEVHTIFRPLIDGARDNNIPENVRSAATELQNRYPNSTMALLMQRILHGGVDPIDQFDLKRWIAATNSEKGPTHAAQTAGQSHTDFDPVQPGTYTCQFDGESIKLIIERTSQGYAAHFPAFPQLTTRAPTALEALSKAHGKLHVGIR